MERYRYDSKVIGGVTRYREIYEVAERDVDTNIVAVILRTFAFIDKTLKLAELQEFKAELLSQAQGVQRRINDLSAVP